jgi:hypothetical protein
VVVAIAASPGCSASSWSTLPRLQVATFVTTAIAVITTTAVVFDSLTWCTAATHLSHEGIQLVLGTADFGCVTVSESATVIVAPVLSTPTIRTIASHVTSLSANATDNAGSVVLLLRAVVLAMTDLTTILTGLVLVVSERTVEGGKLTKLVALELVLTFRDGSSLPLSVLPRVDQRQQLLTVSMTLWINFFALLTFSSVSAMIKQCKSSSWLLV